MKLKRESIEWSIKHILTQHDTDLFPRLREMDAVYCNQQKIIDYLSNIDIGAYCWKENRRFIIPKAENSYRIATQLHLLDSIMLASIIFEFGEKIESHRIPISENRVFNYRFKPNANGLLYNTQIGWDSFWKRCIKKSTGYNYVVYLDISDFYNQIYHHTVEQQLDECGFDKEATRSIINFLGNITQKVSRGIPIGPHAVHLLAELTMIPIDQSLQSKGIDFCRFSDDIVLFAKDKTDAKIIIYKVAEILDKQQRLVLQQQKTKIFQTAEFILHCNSMIDNNPINADEQNIIRVLGQYSDNPYASISHSILSKSELNLFTKEKVEGIINGIIEGSPIDYVKLRWFFRRLAQVGCDGAVEICLLKYETLLPALNDMILYFLAVSNESNTQLLDLGSRLSDLLENRLIKSNEFFQIVIINLFGSTGKFNHIDKLISKYNCSSENIKREIIYASIPSSSSAWIRELKESYPTMSKWCKRAYIMATSILPKDEKDIFLNKVVKKDLSKDDVIEGCLIEWAMSQ